MHHSATDCSICISHFEDDCRIRVLPCTHAFCATCIDPWLERSVVCPNCKQKVCAEKELAAGDAEELNEQDDDDYEMMQEDPSFHDDEEFEMPLHRL